MTWYQSITSKVNYAGDWRELGAALGEQRTLGNMEISPRAALCDAERKVVAD